jgi:glycosyltransferase involved in cell wall biosynthesis
VLVTASSDEGFGIPVIEAMERGTPAVVSNLEIFHEVGGDAAMFFNPSEPKTFARQIEALGERQNWLSVSGKSKVQAAKFSWETSAKKLFELLNRV